MNTLIISVGASLEKNENFNKPELLIEKILSSEKLDERSFGAEITSTASILSQIPRFNRTNLYLLISDTPNGEKIGRILKEIFEKHPIIGFENVMVRKIECLNPDKLHDFKTRGLRNFVKQLGDIYKKHFNSIVINATAGYKAMVSFETIFGFLFEVPVYYMFEGFKEVIELPVMPVKFDPEIWLKYGYILEALENDFKSKEEINEVIENAFEGEDLNIDSVLNKPFIRTFVDIEFIDKTKLYALSALGELYVLAMREKFGRLEKVIKLKSSDVKPDKKLKYNLSEGHSVEFINKNFGFINQLVNLNFIDEVRVVGFSQKYTGNKFKVKAIGNEIKVEYANRGGEIFMKIKTTARNSEELLVAVEKIKELKV